jgi:hypothetical protein
MRNRGCHRNDNGNGFFTAEDAEDAEATSTAKAFFQKHLQLKFLCVLLYLPN